MTRILYILRDNWLTSKELYEVRGHDYAIQIDLTKMTYHLVLVETHADISVQSGQAKTVADLKIKAKKALTDLGVKFKSESRNRKLSE